MPPQLALICSLLVVVWLFAIDRKWRGKVSSTLWIPLIWFIIVTTESPDAWLGLLLHGTEDTGDSSFSALVFLGLILAGLRVLWMRRANWQRIVKSNKWLFIFFLYVGLSITWSDQPLASLKMWMKEVGNILMVLVVLSEQNPKEAVRSFLFRSASILVTLSVLLVKYFPELGRAYDRWTYQPIMVGASTDKNTLGATLLVCALGVFWSFLELRRRGRGDRWNMLAHCLALSMTVWLLLKAHCATALVCVILGVGVLLGMQIPRMWGLVKRSGLSSFVAVLSLLLCMQLVFNVGGLSVEMLGRDATLTGRSEIWKASLQAAVNPLIGAGYCSFWYGERAKAISERLGFFYSLQEAHNGYIETYLTVGLLGLSLLLVALLAGTSKTLKRIGDGDSQQVLRLTIVVVALVYNVTEAAFSGLNPVWFVLLLTQVEYPYARELKVSRESKFSGDLVRRASSFS